MRKVIAVLSCGLIMGLATVAGANVIDLTNSTATTAAGAQVSVLTFPDGGADPLSNCYLFGGSKTNATITFTALNVYMDPIVGYPKEDLWLETTLGGLILCVDGSIADADTDGAGQTTWSMAIYGGGSTIPGSELCQIMVDGDPLTQPGLDIQFNSPDINGDLIVNLTDVVLFSGDFYGAYAYRSDFYWDGTLNLSDIVYLSQGNGRMCPP
jgi:hypothetical protein